MAWPTASGRAEIEARLRRIGGQEDADIAGAESALFLAALDRPRVSRPQRDRRSEDALAVIESMLMIAPGDGGCRSEAGLSHAHLGDPRAAAMALENVLRLGGAPQEIHRAARLPRSLKNRIN